MEENWTFSNLVDSLQTVRKELEVLREEHETIISDVSLQEKEVDSITNGTGWGSAAATYVPYALLFLCFKFS